MNAINITGFVIAAIVWHEFGHFIAADRYEAVENICLIRSKHPILRWFLFGPAIGVDEDKTTGRREWVVLLAPLVWAIPAAGLVGISLVFPSTLLVSQALVWGMAAGFVLISDIPQYLTLGVDEEDYTQWILWSAEGRYD